MTRRSGGALEFDPKTAGEYLGLHERTVRDLANQELACPGTGLVGTNVANNRTPAGRRWRFRRIDLDRWIEARQRAA